MKLAAFGLAAMLAVASVATPALAQHRGGGGNWHGGWHGGGWHGGWHHHRGNAWVPWAVGAGALTLGAALAAPYAYDYYYAPPPAYYYPPPAYRYGYNYNPYYGRPYYGPEPTYGLVYR